MSNKALLDSFISHISVERGLSKNTVSSYKRDLLRFIEFLDQNGWQISTLKSEQISQFIATQRACRLADSSIARSTVAIRTLFKFLAKERGIPDVAREIEPPAIPKRLPKALSISEIDLLLATPSGEGMGIRDRALLELLYATGARVSELVALDLDDIRLSRAGNQDEEKNQADEIITLRLLGKGKKERIVPVGRYAQRAIEDYLVRLRPTLLTSSERALFLNSRGKRLTRQSAWAIVLEAAERAGVAARVTPHGMRHSFATHLLDGGADIRVVQELLGHASVTTTQIYTLVTIDKLRESYATAHPRAK